MVENKVARFVAQRVYSLRSLKYTAIELNIDSYGGRYIQSDIGQPIFSGLNLVVAAVLRDSVCVSLLPCVADCCVSCCIVYVRLSGLS